MADISRGRILGWREAGAGRKEMVIGCQESVHMEQINHSRPGEKGGPKAKTQRTKGRNMC